MGLFRISLELLVILGLALSLYGQETTGTITGAVSDPSGAVVMNAEITVINTGTSATFKTPTNSSGTYTLRTLPVGTYRLSAGAPGFKRYEAGDIVTQVNEITRHIPAVFHQTRGVQRRLAIPLRKGPTNPPCV